MGKFKLEEEDYQVIKFTRKYIQNVLKQFDLTPKQIVGIGNYLFALDRLPLITTGAHSYIQLTNVTVTEDATWEKSYGFTLNEDIFHVDVSGWVESRNGSDSISYPGWYVEANGDRNTDAEVWKLEDELSLLIHLGAKLTVEDLSEIDYEDEL